MGESVTLSVVPEPKGRPHWSLEGPGELSRAVGNPVTFTAAERASAPAISTVVEGQRLSIVYQVVEPESESFHTAMGYPLKDSCAGVWMHLEIEVLPRDVSFGNVQIREVSGEPSLVAGYFTRLTAAERHHQADRWVDITETNDRGEINSTADDASIEHLPKPWRRGAVEWRIPVQWRVINSSYIGTLPDAVQTFTMDGPSGTVTVTKLGASVSRSLSDPDATVGELRGVCR